MKFQLLLSLRRFAWPAVGGAVALAAALALLDHPASDRRENETAQQPPSSPPASSRPANASPVTSAVDWKARVAASPIEAFPALAREIVAAAPTPARDAALAALLSDWLRRGPQGLRAFLDTLGLAEDDALAARFFAALPGALPLLDERVAASPYLRELVSQLIQANAESDPRRALAWAEAWLLDESLDEARATIAGLLARESPDEALRQLDKIRNPLRRIEALSAIGEGYAQADPRQAVKWAQGLSHDTEMMTAMNGVLSTMAQDDPEGARAAFQAVQAGVAGHYQALVAQDRRRRGLPEKPVLDAQGNEIVADAGGEDALPAENPDFNLLGDAATTIAHELAASDPGAALRWADSLPGVLAAGGRRAAIGAWAESDPQAALQYCQSRQGMDAETYGDLFDAWAGANPPAAAAAAGQISSPALRRAAMASVVSTWATNEGGLDAVTRWIDQLPSPADRDAANRALAEATDGDHPQTAWDRALLIGNSDARRVVLPSAFSGLVAGDPAAAGAALSRAGNLTAEERSQLSRLLEGRSASR